MTASMAPDPRRDCQEIARHLATVAFPWDTTRALELALFRTFASPRIGGVLHGTCEFEARTGKRYDDTDLIISEIIEHGFDGPRGARAIARTGASGSPTRTSCTCCRPSFSSRFAGTSALAGGG